MLNACRTCGRPTPGRWCAQHREAGEQAEAANRARFRRPGRSSQRDPQAVVRRSVLERDAYVCRWCGAPAQEADHVVPVKLGGTDAASNMVAACVTCNRSRGASGEPPRRTGSGLPAAASVDPSAPPRQPARMLSGPHRGVGSKGPLPLPPGSSPPLSKEIRTSGPIFSTRRGFPGGRR